MVKIRGDIVREIVEMIIICIFLVSLNLLSLGNNVRIDLTAGNIYSIGKETVNILEGIDEEVEIIFFYDSKNKAMQDSKKLLEQYGEINGKIRVSFSDTYLEPGLAKKYGVRFAGETVFLSKGRDLRTYGGTEVEFTNGLLRVVSEELSVVCFSDGHNEGDINSLESHDHLEEGMSHSHSTGGQKFIVQERHGMGILRKSLETLGYKVRQIYLFSKDKGGGLDSCNILVMGGIRSSVTEIEKEELERFIASGGDIVLMLEPYVESGLGEILASYGIRVDEGIVIDEDRHYWTESTTPAVSKYPSLKVTKDLALTFYPGVLSMSPLPGVIRSDVRVERIVETSEGSYSNVDKDNRGSKTIALEAKKRLRDGGISRLIAIGDSDFATNSYFHILGNGQFILNIINYIAGEEELISIMPRNYQMEYIELSNVQVMITFIISSLLLPILILGCGIMLWYRRRYRGI